jgi:hypothetical protein
MREYAAGYFCSAWKLLMVTVTKEMGGGGEGGLLLLNKLTLPKTHL